MLAKAQVCSSSAYFLGHDKTRRQALSLTHVCWQRPGSMHNHTGARQGGLQRTKNRNWRP